jgi:hypothetical protein
MIAQLRAKYAGDPDILIRICNDLNNKGIHALRGLEWNSGALWAFLNKNTEISDTTTQAPSRQSMRDGVQRMLDLSLQLAEVAGFLRWASDPDSRRLSSRKDWMLN